MEPKGMAAETFTSSSPLVPCLGHGRDQKAQEVIGGRADILVGSKPTTFVGSKEKQGKARIPRSSTQ